MNPLKHMPLDSEENNAILMMILQEESSPMVKLQLGESWQKQRQQLDPGLPLRLYGRSLRPLHRKPRLRRKLNLRLQQCQRPNENVAQEMSMDQFQVQDQKEAPEHPDLRLPEGSQKM